MYNSGSWLDFDGNITRVEAVHQGFYEPFDAEVMDGEAQCGSCRYRQIVLRDLFSYQGRLLAGVPQMKYLEAIKEYLHPLSEAQMHRLERFQQTHPDQYQHWLDRDGTCTDFVLVGFEVPAERQKAILSRLRKLARSLPATFTFDELVALAAEQHISLSGCRDDYDSQYDNYVSFSLTFRVGELRGHQQLYRGIKNFDYRDSQEDARLLSDPSCWFNFEHLFLFVARNLKEYLLQHPSAPLQALFDQMKPAFLALNDGKHKGNALAAEYYRWVPKQMFGREQAWRVAADYLDTLADRYPTAPLATALRTPQWQEKYRLVYDACS